MLNKLKTTIAVVDSGVGGISVLNELIKRYPTYNFIYFADNLYMPYGKKSKRFLRRRADEIITKLKKTYLVDAIIIACNTLSSVIDIVKYKDVFIMSFNKDFTYLATPLTKKTLTDNQIIADSNLASLIERNIFDNVALNRIIKAHVKRFKLQEYSSLVLGCTHYELCYELFKKYCPNTNIIKNSDFLFNELKLDYISNEDKPSVVVILTKPSAEYRSKVLKLIRR